MEGWQWAIVLKPFGLLILFGFTFIVARKIIEPLIPEGKLKRFLFFSWKV
jgi:hypothetical protein